MDSSALRLLNKVREVDEMCLKHQCHMIQLEDKAPFCSECQKEFVEQNDLKIINKAYESVTYDCLKRDSVVTDKTLLRATFDNYEALADEPKQAKLMARHLAGEYLNKSNEFNTIFTGVPGSGKSHLAMAMLKACNEHFNPHESCLFVDVNQLMLNIRESIKDSTLRSESQTIHFLSKVNLLVLDDLGSESCFRTKQKEKGKDEASEFVQRVLFGILNARQRTIITTNLGADELREIYNPKLTSRMFKGSSGKVIRFTNQTIDKREISG